MASYAADWQVRCINKFKFLEKQLSHHGLIISCMESSNHNSAKFLLEFPTNDDITNKQFECNSLEEVEIIVSFLNHFLKWKIKFQVGG